MRKEEPANRTWRLSIQVKTSAGPKLVYEFRGNGILAITPRGGDLVIELGNKEQTQTSRSPLNAFLMALDTPIKIQRENHAWHILIGNWIIMQWPGRLVLEIQPDRIRVLSGSGEKVLADLDIHDYGKIRGLIETFANQNRSEKEVSDD